MAKIRYSDKAQQVTPGALAGSPCPSGNSPAISIPSENAIAAVEARFTLDNTVAINDTLVGFLLPAGHVPVDLYITSDDLDSATTMTVTVGVLDSTLAALVATTNFITASTVCQAGGVARAAVVDGLRLAASNVDRWIGALVVAAPTSVAGAFTIVGSYRASNGD